MAQAATNPPTTQTPPKALTVGEVVLQIRSLIQQRFPQPLWIEGELSNCSYAASGHIYFSLVDEKQTDRSSSAVLPAAFFRNANQHLKFKLTDGLKILCYGEITTYESRGQYQLRVLRVEPKGIGALQLAFDQLKKRLAAEGLFEDSRKRPIPAMPNRIGLITSPHGSAIHDMVSKLRGRFDVIILPAKVQGDGAALEIAQAIETANRLRIAEVLIVGRGGGSVEDLWAFNEESVARAMARSHIPIISAVGHQDDWTIADYVADYRASTPTDAAKWLVQQQDLLVEQARALIEQLVDGMHASLDDAEQCVSSLSDQLRLLHPANQLREYLTLAAHLEQQLVQSMNHGLERDTRLLQVLSGRLQALSPLAVLARGYSITFQIPEHHVVMDATSLQHGATLETRVARGRIISTVTETHGE